MLRSVPLCPTTFEALNPTISVAGIVWVVSPISSAAWPHPEPSVSAMSCFSMPVAAASCAAACFAISNGSAAGSSRGFEAGFVGI
jgi:hypothetical protein